MHELWMKDGDKMECVTSGGAKCPFERVSEERKGWMDYKNLFHKTSDSRYNKAAHDEFSHMLIALADAFAEVRKHVNTTEEQAEFDKFKAELLR